MKKQNEVMEVASTDKYAPRKYSFRETVAMSAKVIGIVGLLLGLLWLVSEMTAK